jgi:predicted  nucleic acid-binding Zn-ribbon protein
LTSDNKVLTDNLWREQSKVKSVESELHDLMLHLKVLQGENTDLKLSLDKEKQASMVAIDRTRIEIERIRDR